MHFLILHRKKGGQNVNDNTIVKKKQWLYRYKNNRIKLARLQEKLSTLEARITSIKSPNYSGMPRGGTSVTIDDLLSDKLILLNRIKRLEDKGIEYRHEILEAIDSVENYKYAAVLEHWFIGGASVGDISKAIGYSNTYISKLYSKALKEIDTPGISK